MSTAKLQIFDPPMCCSSGACGPNVDPKLTQFLSDIQWLTQKGVTVERYNFSGNPGVFAQTDKVRNTLQAEGNGCLPIIMVDEEIVHKGGYPGRAKLAGFCRIDSDATPAGEPATDKAQSCGCSGCGCDGSAPGNSKAKLVTCLVVVLAVIGILVYKNTRSPALKATTTAGYTIPSSTAKPAEKSVDSATETAAVVSTDTKLAQTTVPIGETLESLADLNKVAISQDAVFIFIPNEKNDAAATQTNTAVFAAQNTLKGNNIKIGLYTLSTKSPQYAEIAQQVQAPAILVATKGRGMSAVSGEVSETKLLQAYAATNRAGCGPSSCGPSTGGCN